MIYSGAQHLMFLDDHYYPFKVNPHFKAWLPLVDVPECFLIYSAGAKPRLVYFQPVDYWYKPPEAPSGYWVEHFDVHPVASVDATRDLLPARLERTAFIGEWRTDFGGWGLLQVNPATLLNALNFPRALKTPYELECMRRASALGATAHTAAERAYRAGASEYESAHGVSAARSGSARRSCRTTISSRSIATPPCCTISFSIARPPIDTDRHSLLIDAGAAFNGYAADITRTYSYRDREFRRTHQPARSHAAGALPGGRPGGRLQGDSHARASQARGALLREADFISVPAEDAVASGLSGVFFPHGIGHLLGLQVHDAGGFMRDASGALIEKPAGTAVPQAHARARARFRRDRLSPVSISSIRCSRRRTAMASPARSTGRASMRSASSAASASRTTSRSRPMAARI